MQHLMSNFAAGAAAVFQVVEKEYSIEAILKELAEIQDQGPKNVCVLGTRHCSFLHQQVTTIHICHTHLVSYQSGSLSYILVSCAFSPPFRHVTVC